LAWCRTRRGEEISRPFEQVLHEFARWRVQGVREVTLLGQNVNAYAGAMEDGTLADLATLIHFVAAIDGVERIRFHDIASARFQRQFDRGLRQRCETQ